AADLTARVERTERAEQHAPRRHARLPREHLAHEDPPSPEQLAREAERLRLGRLGSVRAEKRPAPGRHEPAASAPERAEPTRTALAVAHEKRAQPGDSVAGHEPAGDERPER